VMDIQAIAPVGRHDDMLPSRAPKLASSSVYRGLRGS
jgi:hypothetical protein